MPVSLRTIQPTKKYQTRQFIRNALHESKKLFLQVNPFLLLTILFSLLTLIKWYFIILTGLTLLAFIVDQFKILDKINKK